MLSQAFPGFMIYIIVMSTYYHLHSVFYITFTKCIIFSIQYFKPNAKKSFELYIQNLSVVCQAEFDRPFS